MARTAQGKNLENLTVDKTQLLSIQMVNFPVENRGILLQFATGHDDGEGNFIAVRRKQVAVKPAEFAAFASSSPDLSVKGFFGALKDWCYDQIADEAVG